MNRYNVRFRAHGYNADIIMSGVRAPVGWLAALKVRFSDYYKGVRILAVHKCREVCEGCEDYECQDCCPHYEHDHYICLDCKKELDPGRDIDRAMDYMEDR